MVAFRHYFNIFPLSLCSDESPNQTPAYKKPLTTKTVKVKSRAFDIPAKIAPAFELHWRVYFVRRRKNGKTISLSLSGFELSKVVNQSGDWTIMNETISHPNSAMHLIV